MAKVDEVSAARSAAEAFESHHRQIQALIRRQEAVEVANKHNDMRLNEYERRLDEIASLVGTPCSGKRASGHMPAVPDNQRPHA